MINIEYNGTADIYVTERCNMNCLFCSARKKGHDISLKDFQKYVDTWVNYGVTHINITGGEPLLHPDIYELLKYAHIAGMEVALFTNASLLAKDIYEKVFPHIKWLAVSIDGNDYDNYLLGRGENQMTRTIDTLINIRKEFPDILVRVATIVTNLNEKGIYELGEYMVRNGFIPDLWRIKQLIPVRRAVENWDILAIGDDSYQRIAAEVKSKFGVKINVRSNGWKSKSGDLIVTYPDGASGVTIIGELGNNGTVVDLGNIFTDFEGVLMNWETAINEDKWAADNYKEEAWGTTVRQA